MKTLILMGALALVGAGLYARTVGFDFVRADDTNLIADNQPVLRDLRQAPRLFLRSYFEVAGEPAGRKTYYRPLVVLSYMLDAQVAGPAPWMYHLTNVALHVVATLLLFAVVRRLGASAAAAFAAALLFTVHPVNAQAVAWVPGRNDVLMTVLLLISLGAYVRYAERGTTAALAAHLTASTCALFTKEPAAFVIPLVWAYERFWLGRRVTALSRRAVRLVYVGVVLVWLAFRQRALAGGTPSGLGSRDYGTVVSANLPDLLLYAGKVVLPFNLTTAPGLDELGLVLGVLGLGMVVWLLHPLSRSRRIFIALWAGLFLAPSLLVVALPAYEHRVYFPLAGLLAGVAAAGRLPARWRGVGWRWAAVAAATVLFAGITVVRVGIFRDPFTFWADAARSPRYAPLAHVNLGQLFEERGDLERAEAHYREALALDETTPMANNNLGVVLMKRGRVEEAAERFARELVLNPANAQAQYNLGLLYLAAGRPDDAVAAWRRTLAIDPFFAPAYERLAEQYERQGRRDEAARYRSQAGAAGRASPQP